MLAPGPKFKTLKSILRTVWLHSKLIPQVAAMEESSNVRGHVSKSWLHFQPTSFTGSGDQGPCQDPLKFVELSGPHVTDTGICAMGTVGNSNFLKNSCPRGWTSAESDVISGKCPQQPHGWKIPTKTAQIFMISLESPAEEDQAIFWALLASPTSPVHSRVSTVWDLLSILEASLRMWTVKAMPMNRTNCIEAIERRANLVGLEPKTAAKNGVFVFSETIDSNARAD